MKTVKVPATSVNADATATITHHRACTIHVCHPMSVHTHACCDNRLPIVAMQLTMLTKRLLQRVNAVICFFLCNENLSQATKLFNQRYNCEPNWVSHAPREFILDNVQKFKRYGSIENRHPSGRPTTIPDDVVKQCSIALKQGYMTTIYLAAQPKVPHQVHRYYTTIKQACVENVLLAQVCQRYHVTPDHLLRRMHQVDPDLSRRTLRYKLELTMAQLSNRSLTAAILWDKCSDNPEMLLYSFFADECSIMFVDSHASVKVYCDAHDANVSLVLPCKHVKKGQQIKVRLLGVVNAVTGPFYMEFTTGTTDIQRRFLPNKTYKVSGQEGPGLFISGSRA